MAGSRLEKIGTIYTRTSGLIRSGAINWEDRPLWYDIYEAFPPNEDPRYDRPVPNMKLKKIFYKDDKIRAMFHRNNKQLGTTNMLNNSYKSLTQKFIDIYQNLESKSSGNDTEEQLYKDAIEILKRDKDVKKETGDEVPISLSNAFMEAKSNQDKDKIKLDVSNIFKD